ILVLCASFRAYGQNDSSEQAKALGQQGDEAYRNKKYDDSVRFFREALQHTGDVALRIDLFYNLACDEALLKHKSEALNALTEAVHLGYTDWHHAAGDEDLALINGGEDFKKLIMQMKKREVAQRVFDITRWDNPDLGWAALHKF